MKLPRIDLPLFEVTIPSSGKKTKFRPFTVKEEKILLIAQEAKDIDQFILATSQIITNCIPGINVGDLALFDLEYLLLNIRSKSVSSEITFKINDPDTNEVIELTFDISNVQVKFDENHSRFIKLDDDNTLIMRYPSFDQIKLLSNLKPDEPEVNANVFASVMLSCIASIQSGDALYKMADFSDAELNEFFDNLPANKVKDIETFFETMPILRHEIPYKTKAGVDKTFVIEGMDSFFM